MDNKMKYVEDAINSDQTVAMKYVVKFENMMTEYLEKNFVVALAGINEARMIVSKAVESHDDQKVEELKIVVKSDADISIYTLGTDEKFAVLENAALIATNDESIVKNIQEQLALNPDLILSPVLAAIGVALVEERLN